MSRALAPIRSLLELKALAKTSARYRQLLFIASANLGGPETENPDVAYRWLETNALETDERGVVKEVNACRSLLPPHQDGRQRKKKNCPARNWPYPTK